MADMKKFMITNWCGIPHKFIRHADGTLAVERIQAHAGMDVGATLIGMHLRRVVVPVRLSVARIGEASLVCARTRPAYIGGPRAQYQTEEP